MELVFIHPDDKSRSLYRIYLENILEDCKVIEFFNFKKAQDFVSQRVEKGEKACDLILAASEGEFEDHSAATFALYCDQHLSRVPFVTIGERPLEEIAGFDSDHINKATTHHILLPLSPADFRAQILGVVYPDRMRLEPIAAFQKVRLINFFRYNKTHCNVYIRLGRLKYVKVLNANTLYNKSDLDKLKARDIEFLYIRNDDFQRFQVNYFHNRFLEFDASLATTEELKAKLEFTHVILQELVTSLGFSQSAIDLTEKSLKAIYALIDKEHSLGVLLHHFSLRDDYLYDHSYLTSLVACDLLRRMNWFTGERLDALGFAALFHDITVKEVSLARINRRDDERFCHYNESVKEKYLKHPLEATLLVQSHPHIPKEACIVIEQHHETPEGNGFPKALKAQEINPLSAVFIIAHEFVAELEKKNYDQDQMNSILKSMAARFNKGHFKKPMDAFCASFLSEAA
jgi:HD-GYP domain-containing protein (c-di-GMP phosphodiesterase class II)